VDRHFLKPFAAVAALAPSSQRDLAAALQPLGVPVTYIPHFVHRAQVRHAFIFLFFFSVYCPPPVFLSRFFSIAIPFLISVATHDFLRFRQ